MTSLEINKTTFFSIEAFQSGDERAFKALFDQYYQALCYYGQQIAGPRGAAEEIAVDSFLKVWERREHFESIAAIKSFLYITVRNASLDYLKQEGRRTKRELNWGQASPAVSNGDNTVLNQIIRTEVINEIRQAITQLPEHYNQVLDLAFNQGLKSREIAQQLGIPLSTVDNRKARGLAMLKKILSNKSFLTLLLLLHHNQI